MNNNLKEGYQPKPSKYYGYQPSKTRGFQPSSSGDKIPKPIKPETGLKKPQNKDG